jgi:hypothetical protein
MGIADYKSATKELREFETVKKLNTELTKP